MQHRSLETGGRRCQRHPSAWEQRKLGELGSFDKGRGYSKADLSEDGTPLLLYGRLYTDYEAVVQAVDTYATPLEGSLYTRGGEVVVPASGETAEDIAIASCIACPGVLLGGDLNVIRPISTLNPVFLAVALTGGPAHFNLAKRAQGKSVVHIHNDDIADTALLLPLAAEQRRIGALFSSLDSLIALHQRESS